MINAKVLLVDNNISFVDSLIKALRDLCSFAEAVSTLDAAQAILKENDFDVIVYHTAIDDEQGFDALRVFRTYTSQSSIIAYSESPFVNDVVDLLKSGVFDYLTLPFDTAKLVESIKNGIENMKSFVEIINLNKTLVENQQILESEKEDLKKKNKELQTLTNITKAMTGTLKLDEILHEIIHGIYNVFLFDRIFVSLIDPHKGVEEAKVAMGLQDNLHDEIIKELIWEIGDHENNPWMMSLINSKEIVKVVDPLENETYKNCRITKYHPSTFIKVPLITEGNVVGSLTIDNALTNREIIDDEIKTLRVFANHAGIAIEKARLYENLMTAHEQLKEMQKKIIDTEKLMAVNEIVVGVNHEINNPLCAISLNIEVLKREYNNTDPSVKRKLQMIEEDIDRIKNITSKLTKIQKLESTKYTPDVSMIDINRSVKFNQDKGE